MTDLGKRGAMISHPLHEKLRRQPTQQLHNVSGCQQLIWMGDITTSTHVQFQIAHRRGNEIFRSDDNT